MSEPSLLAKQYAEIVMQPDCLQTWGPENEPGATVVVEWFASVGLTEASEVIMAYMRCPTYHRNAVAVEDVSGERVAALCPECDEQLPAWWATAEPGPALP